MIGAPVPGVVNALQVTIPGRSPSVPSVKALGNTREEKKLFFSLPEVLIIVDQEINFYKSCRLLVRQSFNHLLESLIIRKRNSRIATFCFRSRTPESDSEVALGSGLPSGAVRPGLGE